MSNLADLDALMSDLDTARRPNGGPTKVYAPGQQVTHSFTRTENTVRMVDERSRDSPARDRDGASPPISRPKSPASNRKVQPAAQSPRQTGGATAELDDLMASLNDIKVSNDGTVRRSTETTTTTTTKSYNTLGSQRSARAASPPAAAPYTDLYNKNGSTQIDSGTGSVSQADRVGSGSRNSDLSSGADNQCAGCQKNVNGQDCRKPFDSGSFFDLDGKPYCEQHYHLNRGSVCGTCQQPISGRCVTAMGKKFHPDHFVCSYCVRPLNKGTFKEHANKPWCHNCFDRLYGSKKDDGITGEDTGSFDM